MLAEGEVVSSGLFKVKTLGLPPPEPRAASLESLGNLDVLRPPKTAKRAAAASPAASAGASGAAVDPVALQNAMLVVVSDIHIDVVSVRSK